MLLWERALEPFAGRWALPGGYLEPGETLEDSIRRHLAAKVDVRQLSHLEQIDTRSDPHRVPDEWQLATTYLGLVPTDADPSLPADTAWHPVDPLPPTAFDHGSIALAGRERLRAKLSYTNAGFALAPETFTISELRDLYAAALGHEVSATNLQRVLLRRNVLDPTGRTRPPGRSGGRPGSGLPLPEPRAGDHGPVRRAAAASLSPASRAACGRQRLVAERRGIRVVGRRAPPLARVRRAVQHVEDVVGHERRGPRAGDPLPDDDAQQVPPGRERPQHERVGAHVQRAEIAGEVDAADLRTVVAVEDPVVRRVPDGAAVERDRDRVLGRVMRVPRLR